MASPAAILDILVKAETARASAELKLFDKRLSAVDKSAQSSSKSIDKFGRDADRSGRPVDSVSGKLLNLNQAFLAAGNAAKAFKLPVLISAVGPAAQGVSALAAGTTALTGALLPAAGAATGAAAAYGAMGQAAGVIALSGVKELGSAVGGLNEKMDKSADAYKALSPEAKKFAGVLEETKAPLRDIQAAVQKPLFEGMNKGLIAARENLPALKVVLQETARAMGRLAERAGEFVGRKAFGRDFTTIGEGNTKVLERMGRVGFHLADAFRHVMVEAQPLITWMTKAVVRFSEYVEQSAQAGRRTGDLAEFFEETRRILSIVVPAVGDLAKGLWNVLRAGSDLGNQVWRQLAGSAEEFRKWTESAKGENAIQQWFEDAKKPLMAMGRLIGDIGAAFGEVGGGNKGILRVIRWLRRDLLPVMVQVVEKGESFGPVFMDFVSEATKALGPFLGANGPMTLFAKAATTVLRAFNNLVDAVPALGSVLATFLGVRTVAKLTGLGTTMGTQMGTSIGAGLKAGLRSTGIGLLIVGAFEAFNRASGATAKAAADEWAGAFGGRLDKAIADKSIPALQELANEAGVTNTALEDLGWGGAADAVGDKAERMSARVQAALDEMNVKGIQNAKNNVAEMEFGWSKHMRKMAGISDERLDHIGDLLREKPKKGAAALDDAMTDIVASIRQAMKDGEISTRKGSKKIHSVLIDQLGIYGISHGGAQKIIQAKKNEGGQSGLQRGGPIDQGKPRGDSVPAMLEKGEYVLNRNAVSAVGKGQLDALNFGAAKRFAVGGMAGLQPGITRLAQWANKRYGLNISSGFRAGTGSLHNVGAAVDLVPPGMTATKGIFGAFKNQLAELFYDPWGGWNDGQMIGPIGDHLDHIHAAILGAGAGAAKGFGAAKIKLPRFKATAAMFEPGAAGLNNSAKALEKIMGRRAGCGYRERRSRQHRQHLGAASGDRAEDGHRPLGWWSVASLQ